MPDLYAITARASAGTHYLVRTLWRGSLRAVWDSDRKSALRCPLSTATHIIADLGMLLWGGAVLGAEAAEEATCSA